LELHNWKGIVPRKKEPNLEDIGRDKSFLALHSPMINTKPWRVENKNVFGPPKFGQLKGFLLLTIVQAPNVGKLKVWLKAKKAFGLK
jgi:hypothetical protein